MEEVRQNKTTSILIKSDFKNLVVTAEQPIEWHYNGKLIDICWTFPFTKGEKRKVELSYEVVNPISGLYFSSPDSDYPNRDLTAITGIELIRMMN